MTGEIVRNAALNRLKRCKPDENDDDMEFEVRRRKRRAPSSDRAFQDVAKQVLECQAKKQDNLIKLLADSFAEQRQERQFDREEKRRQHQEKLEQLRIESEERRQNQEQLFALLKLAMCGQKK